MITWDELMAERRQMLMSLMREKRCLSLQPTLSAALNAVTEWQRTGSREELNVAAYAAFNGVYGEACDAVDDALELLLLPMTMAAAKQNAAGLPAWLRDMRGAA